MSDVQPSDAAVQAACDVFDSFGFGHMLSRGRLAESDVRAALAAGLAVEYAALADKIEALSTWHEDGYGLRCLTAEEVRFNAARLVRAAAGGTPNA